MKVEDALRCLHEMSFTLISSVNVNEIQLLTKCYLCRLQAINAEPYGVVGVLVYTDPLDMNDGLMSDVNETYPHSWYIPPSGVERGSYSTHYGDPLTPYLAAKGDWSLL